MKKFLLATIVALAFASPAKADNLHPLFLGKWCEIDTTNYYFAPDEEACNSRPEQMTISRQSIDGFEWHCDVLSVQNTKKRTTAWNNEKVPVTIVRARCHEGGDTSSQTIKLTYGNRARLTFETIK
jgi:hypothetical protein